ncbi:MAG: hypothetical protein ACOCRO_07135, partial [Halanaerobiales bacterium]
MSNMDLEYISESFTTIKNDPWDRTWAKLRIGEDSTCSKNNNKEDNMKELEGSFEIKKIGKGYYLNTKV